MDHNGDKLIVIIILGFFVLIAISVVCVSVVEYGRATIEAEGK